jgi:hypothetical protein
MAEWWVDGSGQNMLEGVPDDEDNPAMLTDAEIIDFLQHIVLARASFDRILPTLTAEEQTRLNLIAATAGAHLIVDNTDATDRIQQKWNTAGVRRGGGFRPTLPGD